jgi:elongation factor P
MVVPANPGPVSPVYLEGIAVKAVDLRPGIAVNLDGRLMVVTKYDHVKPGKGPAYAQVKMKDVKQGGYIEKRYGSSDTVEATTLDRRTCEYLYEDADGYIFMDSESFDQFTMDKDTAGDSMLFLRPNGTTTVLFHGETPLLIELPGSVDLVVQDCEPGVKGATVTNVQKEAIMETGLKTRVPDFITVGETLRINTEDGSYMSRSKE